MQIHALLTYLHTERRNFSSLAIDATAVHYIVYR